MHHKVTGWALLALISSSAILHTLAYPQPPFISQVTSNVRTQNPQYYSNSLPVPHREQIAEERKFAEKPNALKKVALDDIDDIQNNSISDGGFSWSNMLGMIMHMLFNPGGTGPNKSDNLDTDVGSPSPWASLLTMGFKILTAILGGGASNDGIDKVDNGNSPMQSILAAVLSTVLGAKDPDQVASMAKQAGEFINIVVNLLDALKTSLSHRSLSARSAGRKDSVSDAALAGIAMLKTYVRSFGTNDDKCLQKYVCDANSECSSDIGPKSVFCQLGTYAASFVLERQSAGTFDQFYEAGRRGRSGIDCRQLYLECNECHNEEFVVDVLLSEFHKDLPDICGVVGDMTLETFPSRVDMASKQLLDRYAEYSSPAHDQPMYFPYEPSPTSQVHIPLSSKHHYGGGGHKNNAAMSALTLLAFLFFLHILQQCIKEHMTALNTPQVMIMTGGKEGEETIRHIANKKVDKTGISETDAKRKDANNPGDATELPPNNDDEKIFTKITSSEYTPWKKFQNNPYMYKNDYNTDIPDFFR